MIVNYIKYHNFKQFSGDHNFPLKKINLVKGKNGIGKTNFALRGLEFVLYNYTGKETLTEQATRGVSKSFWVEVEIQHKGNAYIIKRTYPSKLSIKENGKEVGEKWITAEKEKYIQTLFKDITYFKKFRLIDAYDKDTNFLEKGEKEIKKILLSINAEKINKIRQELLDMKRDRNLYNKDRAVIYKHHPSEKRLKVLENGLNTILKKMGELEAKVEHIENVHYKCSNQLSEIKGELKLKKKYLENAKKYPNCYVCKQKIPIETRRGIIRHNKQEINKLVQKGNSLIPTIKKAQKMIFKGKNIKNKYIHRQLKLNGLIGQLESRLKQKEFKWTNKDCEIVKKSIEHLDTFTSHYIVDRVKVLEPIMNSVLSKINFRINFDVNDKGKFDMVLIDDKEIEWKHYRLSSGQKLLLQIALKFALLIEKGEEGVVIGDEGLGSLDNSNLLHIINLVQELNFQLIFILHRFENMPENINVIDLEEYFKND